MSERSVETLILCICLTALTVQQIVLAVHMIRNRRRRP